MTRDGVDAFFRVSCLFENRKCRVGEEMAQSDIQKGDRLCISFAVADIENTLPNVTRKRQRYKCL